MILKIGWMLCSLVLIGVRSQDLTHCSLRYGNYDSQSYDWRNCDVLASEVDEQTWYQTEAFIKITKGGILTVELLSNDSAPISLNIEGKGVVRLNRDFAQIPSLEWLTLEDNFIVKIENFVFAGLPELIYLNLARNRINHISEHGFQDIRKLEILDLSHNALTIVTEFSLDYNTLPALTHLYLQHNQLENVEYLCNSNLEHLYLSNNSFSFFDPDNYWSEKPCLENLTHLYLEDNNMNGFKIGRMRLEALSLDGSHMTSIPRVSSHTKFLSLARNWIQYIDTLEYAPSIVRLVLSYNEIGSYGFDQEQNQFQNFSFLEHLALDHNLLTSIPDGSFYNLTSLRSLYLTYNMIEYISPKAFGYLPALQELSLANNRLKSFPGEKSFGRSNIRYLDFSNNKVENISDLQINMIPELRVLKLSENPLKRMDPLCSNITIWF